MNKISRDILSKQVAEILPSRKGLENLMKKKKIRLYLGVDPTAPNLHLGHAVVLRKLRQFQDLGHEVILVFGTFTGLIGDPSGRDKAREPLSSSQIRTNMATYKKQAGKILDVQKLKVKTNGEWLGKLRPEEFLKLASHITASQLLERDMFQNRMKKGGEVWVSELLYPLLQGYDSVAMDVDLEVGGTDQTFNMLVGRRLQKAYRGKEKFVLTVPLLLGPDGNKMSKSAGNVINVLEGPQEMFGKLMSMKDELIGQYFELCTNVLAKDIRGLMPREAKVKLAKEIVTTYHGKKEARLAEKEFERIFRKKETPKDIPTLKLPKKKLQVQDMLLAAGFAKSKAEARRLVGQGGVKINGETQTNALKEVQAESGWIMQVGKRRFTKIG